MASATSAGDSVSAVLDAAVRSVRWNWVESTGGNWFGMARASLCFLAVLCSFLQEGLALHCYECNSKNDPSCLENPPKEKNMLCPTNFSNPVCRVIKDEVKINGTYDTRIIRSCGQRDKTDDEKPCYRISEHNVDDQRICSCFEDGCNSSTMPVAAASLMLLSVVSLWL